MIEVGFQRLASLELRTSKINCENKVNRAPEAVVKCPGRARAERGGDSPMCG